MPALKSTQKKKGAGGRPPSYKADYATQAARLCELGATDEEVAAFFLVSVRTVYRWKLDYPEFCHALKNGKDVCDDRVERSLYQKATGGTFIEQQAFKVKTVTYKDGKRLKEVEKVEIVEVERIAQPDTTAQIFWLKNRRKDDWRDRQDHGHSVDGPLAELLKAVSGGAFRPATE